MGVGRHIEHRSIEFIKKTGLAKQNRFSGQEYDSLMDEQDKSKRALQNKENRADNQKGVIGKGRVADPEPDPGSGPFWSDLDSENCHWIRILSFLWQGKVV